MAQEWLASIPERLDLDPAPPAKPADPVPAPAAKPKPRNSVFDIAEL